jgi:hypothetical protein
MQPPAAKADFNRRPYVTAEAVTHKPLSAAKRCLKLRSRDTEEISAYLFRAGCSQQNLKSSDLKFQI